MVYFNRREGRTLKSVTIPVMRQDRIIGLVCMNFQCDVPFSQFISTFLPTTSDLTISRETESFNADIDEVISTAMAKARESVSASPNIPSTNRNKEIIRQLYQQGIFNIKDAVVYVSASLGILKEHGLSASSQPQARTSVVTRAGAHRNTEKAKKQPTSLPSPGKARQVHKYKRIEPFIVRPVQMTLILALCRLLHHFAVNGLEDLNCPYRSPLQKFPDGTPDERGSRPSPESPRQASPLDGYPRSKGECCAAAHRSRGQRQRRPGADLRRAGGASGEAHK